VEKRLVNNHPRNDFLLLLGLRGARAFGFGFAAVLVGLHLESRGLSARTIGLTLTIGLLAASFSGLLLSALARSQGNAVALAVSGGLMALSGLDLALPVPQWLLVLAGVTGMLGAASVDLGPFASVEQAAVADSISSSQRNRAFARYALTGGIAAAAGSLAAGLGSSAGRSTAFFGLYAMIGVLTALLALRLSKGRRDLAEGADSDRLQLRPVAVLTVLFGLDSLGGGFVVQAVLAYWLHARFGAGAGVLGPAFAVIAVLQAASYELAGRIADRVGLVRTMVFTHLPSNVLLVLVPLMPSLGAALAVLFARFSIAQMDVPARQAYVVSIVHPSQRAVAAAMTTAARAAGQAVGPILAGTAIQAGAYRLPFFLAGGVKILYDIALYAGFRSRAAEHELRV
jgi:MFS family permease